MKTSWFKVNQLIRKIIKEEQFYIPGGMDIETIKKLKATSDRDPEGGLEGVLDTFTKLLPVSHENIVLYIFEGLDEKFDYKFDDNEIFHIVKRNEIQQQPFKDLVDKHPSKKIIFLNKRFYHKLTDFISAKDKPKFKLADVFTPFYILHDFSHTVLNVNSTGINFSKFTNLINNINLLISDKIIATITDNKIKIMEDIKKNYSQNWKIFIDSLNSKLKTGKENIYASDDTYATIRSIIMYCIENILDARLPDTFTGPQDHIPNLIKYVDDLSISFDNLNADNFIDTFTSVFNNDTKEALIKDLKTIKTDIERILEETKKDYVSFIEDIRDAIAERDNVSLIGFDANSLMVVPMNEARSLIRKIIKEEIKRYRY